MFINIDIYFHKYSISTYICKPFLTNTRHVEMLVEHKNNIITLISFHFAIFFVVVVSVLFPFAWEIWWLQLHCSRLDFKRLHVYRIVSYVRIMFIEKCLYFLLM